MVFPCIEASTGGELCFISSTHGDRRIQCNIFGNVTMNKNWKGWEVWRFVRSDRQDGSFYISSWTHSDFYLSSHPEGHVTSSKNQLEWELWKVERSENADSVRILSLEHNRWLQFRDGNLTTIEHSGLSHNCLWTLNTANLGKFFLHCNEPNKQIGCPQNADGVPFLTDNRKEWEVWKLQKAEGGNGCFTIRSNAHGWYLRPNPESDQVYLSGESASDKWHLEKHGESMAIVSSSGRCLRCSPEGHFYMFNLQDDKAPCTSWSLEPK